MSKTRNSTIRAWQLPGALEVAIQLFHEIRGRWNHRGLHEWPILERDDI